MSDFWSDLSSTSILYVCKQPRLWWDCRCAGSPAPSLVAYVLSTIISWAGSFTYQISIQSYTYSLQVQSCKFTSLSTTNPSPHPTPPWTPAHVVTFVCISVQSYTYSWPVQSYKFISLSTTHPSPHPHFSPPPPHPTCGVSSDLDGCRGALKREVFFILSFVFLSEFVIRQVQTNIY